ncbi:MAG: hypothetical protein ACOYEH_07295 [Caldicoprobacterales bacterium]|jgi:hypothetical protein|nr:hypothetical protein [Clostridiales bacterium]
MDIELLVERVVREVLERLPLQGKDNSYAVEPEIKKPLLAVLPRHIINLDKYVDHLIKTYQDYELTLMAPRTLHGRLNKMGAIDNLVDIGDQGCTGRIMDEFHKYETICCIAPGIKLMESITGFDDTETAAYMIINSILNKKKTVLFVDCLLRSFPENATYEKVNKIINKLKNLGIAIEFIGRHDQAEQKCEAEERELITEKDIIRLWEEGIKEIIIKKGALITPLAIDKANETGIEIHINER